MSHRFSALALVLGAFLCTASLAALWVGSTDALLAAAGPMRRMEASRLDPASRGWFELGGCVRHDLAVVVTAAGVVYRLGEAGPEAEDSDRIYTPLAAREDCAEERAPSRVYALIEDAEATNTTLGRVAQRRVAPPPIPATVDGTIGPRVGDHGRADKARARLAEVSGLAEAPLLRKHGHPGPMWVALLTCGSGLHGLLLLVIGARYLRRRAAQREAMREGQVDEAEEQFFRTETLE